jgi:hypothetical protein
MDEVTVRLPIRLVPRKSGQMLKLGVVVFGFLFALVWNGMTWNMMGAERARDAWFTGFGWVFPAFGLFILVSATLALIGTIAKLLPGSPFFHLGLSADTLIQRSGFRHRRFAWSVLSPFAVAIRTINDEGSKKHHYWVVALRAKEADRLADEQDRYKRAIVRIDAAEYGEGDGDAASAVLADLLNEIRAAALVSSDNAFTIPPELRDAVIARGALARETAQPKRSGGVIER